MITELNRFIIAIVAKRDKAKEEAIKPSIDHQYNNGYYQGLEDAYKLALDIYHGTNGY